MADIPRFNAQIQQITVVRMKDAEYEQNQSIYKTLKAAGERINDTFFSIVAQGDLPQKDSQDATYYDRMKEAIFKSNIDNKKG